MRKIIYIIPERFVFLSRSLGLYFILLSVQHNTGYYCIYYSFGWWSQTFFDIIKLYASFSLILMFRYPAQLEELGVSIKLNYNNNRRLPLGCYESY